MDKLEKKRIVRFMTKRFGVAIIGLHNWYHAYPLTIAVGHMLCLNLVTVSHDDPLQIEEFSDYRLTFITLSLKTLQIP